MIILSNLTLRRGVKVVLDQVNCTIQAGEKVGLIGRNGAGKSSLFALLNGKIDPDGGSWSIPKNWCIAEVAQQLPEGDEPATDFVIAGDPRLLAARQALALLEAQKDVDGNELALAHQHVMDAGSHDAHARAQSLLLGLGFSADSLYDGVGQFSGGWRMRLQLARTLMSPSDLLLLDEPTNHLDLDALVWLEEWLSRYQGTLVIISHDRDFLDSMVNVTVHLDRAKLTRYSGNYSAFERQRSERLILEQSAFESQQEKIAHLNSFIERFKAKASKAKQAQSRIKALERMDKLGPILTDSDFSFEFRPVTHLPNPMLVLERADLGYQIEAQQKIILPNVNVSIRAGMRLGVLGANGQGKSTLVKTLAMQLALLNGDRTEGRGVVMGYFAQQELDILILRDSPLQHLIDLSRRVSPQAKEQELRNFLGRFQFKGDDVTRAVESMSGGEKARLVLMLMAWQKPNVLILDEPTNHLDISTRTALSMALNTFDGAVILVSHDRSLLRTVCDEFWLVGAGEVKPFEGDLNDYQEYLMTQARARTRSNKKENKRTNKTTEKATEKLTEKSVPVVKKITVKLSPAERQEMLKRQKRLQTEVAKIERGIALFNEEKSQLQNQLNDSKVNFAEVRRRLKTLEEDIAAQELRWIELLEQIEQI